MAALWSLTTPNAGQAVERQEVPFFAGGNAKMVPPPSEPWKVAGRF